MPKHWRSHNEGEEAMLPPKQTCLENTRKETVGLKKMSVTDDFIDWPHPNKILGCAAVPQSITVLLENLFTVV